ncbi:hypothetical protein BT63DRAFT_246462 [Microthyrium microscopicum]|uniref:Zn(2)-C6 fungal-type domain-containing protein n=1 Tax=Microthyrium microscopicum TaxID=703497 RepID=A0A6A6U9K8_9PEZI|nr:hypothetical protein BT63DRAFT_246462 [Microthyrium microscopicum]
MAAAIDPRLGQYSQSTPPLQHQQMSHQLPHHSQHQPTHLPPLSHSIHHSSYHTARQTPQRPISDSPSISYYSNTPPNHPRPHPLQPPDQSLDNGYDHDDDDDNLISPNDGSPHDETSPMGPGGLKGPNEKRPRACDSCRGLKVKCIIDPTSGDPCKRCAKAGRQCIVTPPTRKRQKKADSRVAELERKIDALTASLQKQNGKMPEELAYSGKRDLDSYESSPVQPRSADYALSPERSSKRPRLEKVNGNKHEPVMAGSDEDPNMHGTPTIATSIYNQMGPKVYDHSDIDQKLDSIISRGEAERLFHRYVEEFVPRFPAVPFPPGTTAQEVRTEKPILFLAILSGTSYGANIQADIQIALERELRNVFAECMWKNGEKSLQLVQALQVGALWYRPPANFEQHMFYQMVHMATIMGLDIGIGKRTSPWRKKLFDNKAKVKLNLPDPEGIESRRAWLVNYFLCITIAMILRRPILLRFNDFMQECINILETSEEALPSDKALCQHVQLARISEEIAIQFAMDDPGVNLSINDGKVSYGIKHHEKDLQDLRARNNEEPAIQLSSHVTNLYLHEIALHSQSNVDDFKAPFTEETFRAAVSQVVLGPSHVDALVQCQESCQNVVQTFLDIDIETIFMLPVIFSVRIIYAVVVLMKLYISATAPGEISNVINENDLNLEEHLEKLENSFARIRERDSLAPHTKFYFVIQRLFDHFRGIKSRAKNPKATTSCSAPPEGIHHQAQALHLLSEVAMGSPAARHHAGSSSAPAATPVLAAQQPLARAAPQQQQQPQQQHPHPQNQQNPQQGWYQHTSPVQPSDMTLSMDGMYEYNNGAGYNPIDTYTFDYGLGGMDGGISGLFMSEGWVTGGAPGFFSGWHGP